jgi:membrane protein YqaA with SNARE-associated domain
MLRAAAHPKARGILFGVSVAEASVFPIPQGVMMVPMVAAQPAIWWRVGVIATAGSVIGGLIGYLVGWALYESVAVHIIAFYNLNAAERRFRDLYEHYGWLVVAVAAVTPIPYKLATIASGMVLMPLLPFLVVCLLARGPAPGGGVDRGTLRPADPGDGREAAGAADGDRACGAGRRVSGAEGAVTGRGDGAP